MSRINENSGDEHELEIRTENAPRWWGTKMIPGDKDRPKHPDYGYGYKFDFSKLLDIEELSEELSLKPEDLKNYIDEPSETTVYVQKKSKITKENAKEKLIDYLWRHREDPNGMSILVSGWILKPQTLLDRGIESGPIFGKLIKEFKDLYQDKRSVTSQDIYL